MSKFFLLGLFTVTLLSGCAIQPTSDGKLRFELDEAALIGEQLETFRLANGGTGTIRKLNQIYSIKLDQYQQVIPIGHAIGIRLLGVENVNNRTVVIIEKIEPQCNLKTQVFAIDGVKVSGWEIGNCLSSPVINTQSGSIAFDYAHAGQELRYVYWEGHMLHGDQDLQAGASAAVPVAVAADIPRYIPPLPRPFRKAYDKVASNPADETAGAKKTPPKSAPSTEPKGTQPVIVFPKREQKATLTLFMDKVK